MAFLSLSCGGKWYFIAIRFWSSLVLPLVLVSLFLISCSMYRYYDLKKVVAFSSILHLNLALLSLFSLNSLSILACIILSISHAFSSVGLFLFVGCLISITYSRSTNSLCLLDATMRLTFLCLILANLSFPGSLNFIAELLCLSSLASIHLLVVLTTCLSTFITAYFWWLIYNRKSLYVTSYQLNLKESSILLYLILASYLPGVLLLL